MLRAPDKRARKLLDLANLIEELEPHQFDMKRWNCCICGHYLQSQGDYNSSNWKKAARLLGLSEIQASTLFAPPELDKWRPDPAMSYGPTEAADRIRKFAFTLVD